MNNNSKEQIELKIQFSAGGFYLVKNFSTAGRDLQSRPHPQSKPKPKQENERMEWVTKSVQRSLTINQSSNHENCSCC